MAAPSSRLNIRLKPMTAQPINPLIAGSDVLAQLVAIKATKPINITTYAPITQTARESKRIINPITGNDLPNTYRNRIRINKSIEKYNQNIQEKVNDAIANVKTIKNPDFVFDKPNMRVIRSDVVFDRTRDVKIGSFANKQIVSGVLTGKDNVRVEDMRVVSATLNFNITYENWSRKVSGIDTFPVSFTINTTNKTPIQIIGEIKQNITREIREKQNEISEFYDVAAVSYVSTSNLVSRQRKEIVRLNDVLMRDFKILNIDGEEIQNFNNNMGTCVIDFMRYYYKADKYYMKKKLTDAYLDECWKHYIETHKSLTGKTINWRTDGVNSEMICAWCVANRIPMIAMDIDYNQVLMHSPEVRNKDAPSFIFRIHNKHIYPVMDKKIIDSLVQKFGKNRGTS